MTDDEILAERERVLRAMRRLEGLADRRANLLQAGLDAGIPKSQLMHIARAGQFQVRDYRARTLLLLEYFAGLEMMHEGKSAVFN